MTMTESDAGFARSICPCLSTPHCTKVHQPRLEHPRVVGSTRGMIWGSISPCSRQLGETSLDFTVQHTRLGSGKARYISKLSKQSCQDIASDLRQSMLGELDFREENPRGSLRSARLKTPCRGVVAVGWRGFLFAFFFPSSFLYLIDFGDFGEPVSGFRGTKFLFWILGTGPVTAQRA